MWDVRCSGKVFGPISHSGALWEQRECELWDVRCSGKVFGPISHSGALWEQRECEMWDVRCSGKVFGPISHSGALWEQRECETSHISQSRCSHSAPDCEIGPKTFPDHLTSHISQSCCCLVLIAKLPPILSHTIQLLSVKIEARIRQNQSKNLSNSMQNSIKIDAKFRQNWCKILSNQR